MLVAVTAWNPLLLGLVLSSTAPGDAAPADAEAAAPGDVAPAGPDQGPSTPGPSEPGPSDDGPLETADPGLVDETADDVDVPGPARIAGTYVGGALTTTVTATRLSSFESAPPLYGFSMSADAGSVVFPWMSIGFSLVGGNGYAESDGVPLKSTIAGLLADIAFYPKPNVPLSLRVGFGAGFGRVEERESSALAPGAAPDSQVFGGALFQGAVRYTFFPGADRRRPRRNGGLALGPQVSWLGHTPSERGASMANTVLLGLWTGFFLGNP